MHDLLIISDASPLIAMADIGALDLLRQLYHRVVITDIVRSEINAELPAKLIIDENKGRSVAKRLGLKVTGTIGVIIKAKEQGLIHSGKDLLDKLDQHGFWLSEKLKRQIMERMKE